MVFYGFLLTPILTTYDRKILFGCLQGGPLAAVYKWSYNSIGEITPVSMASLPIAFSAIYKGAPNWSLHEKTSGNGTSETKAIPKAIPTRFRTSDTPRTMGAWETRFPIAGDPHDL